MNKLKIYLPIALCSLIMFSTSCKKDKPEGTDLELYEMSNTTAGFTWYKNSNAALAKSDGSGHTQPFLRTRYNSTAAAMLDSVGKVKSDAAFPNGSLIVKELLDDQSKLSRYAILFKSTGHEDADANGWVWGYMEADGKVVNSAVDKGAACISCHSQGGNIDYMLMNLFFP